jgi:hypothetical protein
MRRLCWERREHAMRYAVPEARRVVVDASGLADNDAEV